MEDYKVIAENLKDEGNAAFQLGTAEGVQRSIDLYTQAIELIQVCMYDVHSK